MVRHTFPLNTRWSPRKRFGGIIITLKMSSRPLQDVFKSLSPRRVFAGLSVPEHFGTICLKVKIPATSRPKLMKTLKRTPDNCIVQIKILYIQIGI